MTVLLGALFGVGILLVASPRLWPAHARPLATPPRKRRLGRMLAAAGLSGVRPAGVVAASCGLAVVVAAATWLVVPVPVVALLAGGAAAAAPFSWLSSRGRRLLSSRRALWPDVCDLLIASVRSGMSIPEAVAALAESGPVPLRPPFADFARDLRASGHFDSAAGRLKTALADPAADRMIETLRMARQVGGTELVAVLRALASGVRADAAVRAEVASRQSWTRAAAVLGLVAPWVVLALLALRPEGAAAYSSPAGIALIVGGAAVSLVAYRLMSRVARLREPRRWFG